MGAMGVIPTTEGTTEEDASLFLYQEFASKLASAKVAGVVATLNFSIGLDLTTETQPLDFHRFLDSF